MCLEQLIYAVWNYTHGYGILQYHLIGHAYEQVCLRTYPFLAA